MSSATASPTSACRNEKTPYVGLDVDGVEAAHRPEGRVVGCSAGDGDEPCHLGRRTRQPPDAIEYQLAQLGRYRAFHRVELGCQELLREERVAVGAEHDAGLECWIRLPTEDCREDRAKVVGGEWTDLVALDAWIASELQRQVPKRVAGRDRIRPVGPDKDEVLGRQIAGEVGDEVERRGIGPLEILEDDDEGGATAEPADDAEEELEPDRAGRWVRAVEAFGDPYAGSIRRPLDAVQRGGEIRDELLGLGAGGAQDPDQSRRVVRASE